MSFLASLLAWANVPFTVALGTTVGFVLLQVSGVLGLLAGGEHDADHDGMDAGAEGHADLEAHAEMDAPAGLEAHAEMDAPAGLEVHAAGDAPADLDAHAEPDAPGDPGTHGAVSDDTPSVAAGFLQSLGVGKVPLSILWQTFGVTFGFTGLALNTACLTAWGHIPGTTVVWTLPLATVTGLGATRALGRALGRLLSDPAQQATSRRELVGQSGVVISSKVDGEFGEIRLKDKTGFVLRIICRTREGDPVIAEGTEVVIVEHDRATDRLFVAPLDLPLLDPGRPR